MPSTSAKGVDLTLTQISVAFYFSAAATVVWMSSPKLKLYTHKRDRRPEGLRKLDVLAEACASDEGRAEAEVNKYLRLANQRERRDMIAFVERRALLTATLLFILGLVIDASVILLG